MRGPRVPYRPEDVADPAELVAAIRARRGGTLLHLDRMLLHSAPLARAWNAFLGAMRGELAVPARLRELVICAVGAADGVEYELHHHGPLFLAAGGSEAQLAALRRGPDLDGAASPFDETERAVLRLALEMTREVSVREATFAAARELLGERGVVEVVALVAAYNMVARFLVALEIAPE